MKRSRKNLVIAVLLPLIAGGLSALLTKDGMLLFDVIKKPPLSPPAWLFPAVWTLLYILMGIASYLVWVSRAPQRQRVKALGFYAVQLIFNFVWSIIFFNLNDFLFAFVWLCALWLLILITMLLFFRADRRAGWLLVPYLLWVSFAGYLNYGIYLLN